MQLTFLESGRALRLLHLGDSTLAVTAVVIAHLLAAAVLPHPVAAVEIILHAEMIGTSGTTTVTIATMIAGIVTTTAGIAIMIAGTVIVNVLVIALVALRTGSAMLRMIGSAAMTIESAAMRSVKMSQMVKTGKVCGFLRRPIPETHLY